MAAITIVQVSDTHLSRTHAYFHDNWTVFVDEMHRLRPDLVVHSGDVSFNGPDAPEDIAFAREEMGRLPCPFVAIPGNHDVGEPPSNTRLKQPIDERRRAVWHRHYGPDWFVRDIGDWRLVGLDSELIGSGLDAEAEQEAFAVEALSGAGVRPIGLFVHKPLFLEDPGETDVHGKCVMPEPRHRLLEAARRHDVRFVASGHLHTYRHVCLDGMDVVWAPTTAFLMPENARRFDGEARSGYVVWHLDGERHTHELVRPPLFLDLDLTNWRKQEGSSTGLPPRPLARG